MKKLEFYEKGDCEWEFGGPTIRVNWQLYQRKEIVNGSLMVK